MTAPARAIRSREHLLHALAEAAELEHNLLCSYLYAAFSLKQHADEDLRPHELLAVQRWRSAIMQVCVEEMSHLAQVANLMLSVGSRPHFDRPNLPVAPGYHPAGVQIALRRFDLETLQHFIYLERPEDSAVSDGAAFRATGDADERREPGLLMPSAPRYETVGEFYRILEEGFVDLADELGERSLFLGPTAGQLHAEEIEVPELSVVSDLATARRAIHLIVVQGEGLAEARDDSHFRHFNEIAEEYRHLLDARPSFTPSRPVASNPVMRDPQAADRVHVDGSEAAPLIDAANAVYSLMLRCLVELYEQGGTPQRRALLGAAFGLMKVLGELASHLTRLPARDAPGAPNAGISFAMLRSTEGFAPGVDPVRILRQRFADIESHLGRLRLPEGAGARWGATVAALRQRLEATASPLAPTLTS